MKQFGPQGYCIYFLNYPSKLFADEVNCSCYEMFLLYSATYINQHLRNVNGDHKNQDLNCDNRF